MADPDETTGQNDRSPAYPIIPLKTALERLAAFETHFKRSAARPEKVGEAWGIKAKAYADRTLAALRYFGLVDYQGTGKSRNAVVSEEGRKYLRAQQQETKREVVKAVALRPKQIAKFWSEWGADRPADAACLDQLVLKEGFSEVGARGFLKVYDETITFAGLSGSDKIPAENGEIEEGTEGSGNDNPPPKPPVPPLGKREIKPMAGERELITGPLSKDGAAFRLIVSGNVGLKEIERLIKKLEFEKEILAENSEEAVTDK